MLVRSREQDAPGNVKMKYSMNKNNLGKDMQTHFHIFRFPDFHICIRRELTEENFYAGYSTKTEIKVWE